MADLPDLVLLRVFDFLDTRQLLRLRAVCRRWRDVALDPAVWRHRAVTLTSELERAEGLAVLSLAPCVKHLVVDSWTRCSAEVARVDSVVRSSCAAQSLSLEVGSFLAASRIVRRQVALGRLTEILISFIPSAWVEADADAFAELLVTLNTSRVEVLDFRSGLTDTLQEYRALVGRAVDASAAAMSASLATIKTLKIRDNFVLNALPSFFMRVHANSLENVDLHIALDDQLHAFSGFPVTPNLRRLACPLLEDMSVLLHATRLKSLELCVFERSFAQPGCLASAAGYFRQATWLRKIHLSLYNGDAVSPVFLDVVRAIGDSGSSALQSLGISFGEEHMSLLHRVAAVLPRLPSLRYLFLSHCSLDSFAVLLLGVAAMRPDILQMLVLQGNGPCLHYLLHTCELRRLLRSHAASLHVLLGVVDAEQDCDCPTCQEGCHAELRQAQRDGRRVVLYVHADSQPCDMLHHAGRLVWVRVPPEELTPCPSCPTCGSGQ